MSRTRDNCYNFDMTGMDVLSRVAPILFCVGCGGAFDIPPPPDGSTSSDAGGEIDSAPPPPNPCPDAATPDFCFGQCRSVADCRAMNRNEGALSCGDEFTCAINLEGVLKCWGYNRSGQLGSVTSGPDSNQPVAVALPGVTWIGSALFHTCAVAGGGAYCWGVNQDGQLGDGTKDDAYTPTPVAGLASDVLRIGGADYSTCALTEAGSLYCWGCASDIPQVSDPCVSQNGGCGTCSTPLLTHVTNASALSFGLQGTCALIDGGVQCWGYSVPTGQIINPSSHAMDIGAGDSAYCATLADGSLQCWGADFDGQLGDGKNNYESAPVTAAIAGVVGVSGGYGHTCAVLQSGAVMCWGMNLQGQLGDGTNQNSATPVVALSGGAIAVSCGGYHSCALMKDGSVMCWGLNYYGQLGNGTTTDSNVPVAVIGL